MNIVESCATCRLRGQRAFCSLSAATLENPDEPVLAT